MHTHVYIYIYIDIYLSLSIYIYIHIYTHTGCLPMYSRLTASPELIGVTCNDINMLGDIDKMKNKTGWTDMVFGKGQMGSALTGSSQILVVF